MQQDAVREPRANLAPIPFEADAPFLKIIGELPRELNGTLYRNGPNPQFDSPGAHWFVGDGMLHGVRLEDGKALWYRNRWLRSTNVSEALGEKRAPSSFVQMTTARLCVDCAGQAARIASATMHAPSTP